MSRLWQGLALLALLRASQAALTMFSNDTMAIWAPAEHKVQHVLLRPATLQLDAEPAHMTVLVTAAPDAQNGGRVLALYKLFVNGELVGIGPGRSEGKQSPDSTETVYDMIQVPADVLAASPDAVSVALQCYHEDGGDGAWAMLEAEVVDAGGELLGRFSTSSTDWLMYNADSIFKAGEPDTGSAYLRVNEDIDARAFQNVSGWRFPDYEAQWGWTSVDVRFPNTPPASKKTLPLAVEAGIMPVEILQLSHGHYFFDFGIERMAGVSLTIPLATAAAWGGAGTEVEIRLGEQLGHFDKHTVLFPGLPLDPGNWNKIPKYISVLTLADGDSHFEHHEYVGLWRYGEIRVRRTLPKNAGANPFSLTQWSVMYPWQDEASFVSSNVMLNRVWKLCADTIRYTSLDTFTDSNVRERVPYEADGFVTSLSFWALRSERQWPRHSMQFILNNPTWPTEWKQYAILLVHGHYMQTGDTSIVSDKFEQLVNQTMFPFVDGVTDLVNFTSSETEPMGKCFFGGRFCNSPMCHNDAAESPAGAEGRSCDNIDWLPKFRAGYHFSPVSSIINAFAVRTMALMSELANATGRSEWGSRLSVQAERTRRAMLSQMRSNNLWCDGLCAITPSTSFHSQHYPLWLGLTPPDEVVDAFAYLQRQGMMGSTYSANSLLHGLYERAARLDYGQASLDLMTQCTEHSWCNMLREGATTTWEHWWAHDGTHSHPWASSPVSAIASGLMGIRPIAPGWSIWMAKPAPGNLTSAAITVPTSMGAISINFTRSEIAAGSSSATLLQLEAGIPVGTVASLCMPLFGTVAPVVLALDGVAQQRARSDDEGAYSCLDGVSALGDRHTRVVTATVLPPQFQVSHGIENTDEEVV